MKLRAFLVCFLVATTSFAQPADPETEVREARKAFTFCSAPRKPLKGRELCSLKTEVDDCTGFAAACDEALEAPKDDFLAKLAMFLAPLAKVLLYLLVAGIALAIAIPLFYALAKRRRDRVIAKAAPANAAVVVAKEAPAPSLDAEEALALAETEQTRGAFERALGLYLAAALAALDRRGLVRRAPHRTNGEYVRACGSAPERATLRTIVNEVESVEFGGARPTKESVDRIASLVRTILVAALVLACAACSGFGAGADPNGDDLPRAVLSRTGFTVRSLPTSLATLPMPEEGKLTPIVVIDVSKVTLEADAQAHLMRWVEAGGALVLFGDPHDWPREIASETSPAAARDLVVTRPSPSEDLADLDSEQATDLGASTHVSGGAVARAESFAWSVGDRIALLGDAPYAIRRRMNLGVVLGVANDDLFTNVGAARKGNATALVELVRSVAFEGHRSRHFGDKTKIEVARAEDGIPAPSNPFSALVAAGLKGGLAQACLATLLLFLAYGIRQSRPRRAFAESPRRAFVEHIRATGALYAAAKAEPHALAVYGKFFDLRLREILPRGADPVTYLATRSGRPPEQIRALYTRAMEPPAERKGDELEVITQLIALLSRPS